MKKALIVTSVVLVLLTVVLPVTAAPQQQQAEICYNGKVLRTNSCVVWQGYGLTMSVSVTKITIGYQYYVANLLLTNPAYGGPNKLAAGYISSSVSANLIHNGLTVKLAQNRDGTVSVMDMKLPTNYKVADDMNCVRRVGYYLAKDGLSSQVYTASDWYGTIYNVEIKPVNRTLNINSYSYIPPRNNLLAIPMDTRGLALPYYKSQEFTDLPVPTQWGQMGSLSIMNCGSGVYSYDFYFGTKEENK